MNIGVTTVKGEDYHPNFRLKEAASNKGHSLFFIDPYSYVPGIIHKDFLINKSSDACVRVAAPEAAASGGVLNIAERDAAPGFSVMDTVPNTFARGVVQHGISDVTVPDVVIPRQGAMIGTFSLTLTSHFKNMGIPMVNDIEPIIIASNQFLTLQHLARTGISVPDTLFISSLDNLSGAVHILGGYPVIAKEINGRQGRGVFLLDSKNEALSVALSFLDREKGLLLQRFIPIKGRRDIRVLVVGGKVAGAMELFTSGEDFRANYHLNNRAAKINLSKEMKDAAVKAASAVGLDIAGVDLIVDKKGRIMVIEVNYSPGFKGIEKTTGLDIAGLIIDYAFLLCSSMIKPFKT
ncbi:MAG: RimK family alpha-L-glutamate ligase [Thermodesulfobacteriota bacterium]|nr:RimK family alpha-L-glutamate ligase [Thermodesulfobacteriota bacterium]